jgi:hypothetical protein
MSLQTNAGYYENVEVEDFSFIFDKAPEKSVIGELAAKVWNAVVTFFMETMPDFVMVDIPLFFQGTVASKLDDFVEWVGGFFIKAQPMSQPEAQAELNNINRVLEQGGWI